MSKRFNKAIQKSEQQRAAIERELDRFFGGITQNEAAEVFRVLALLAQFPGASPPAPLVGCEVFWHSTLKVGDSLERQVFGVTAIYRGLLFEYTSDRRRIIQLPDSSLMNFESWDYQALLLKNRVLAQIG